MNGSSQQCHNIYAAIRANWPDDRDAPAIEASAGGVYRWGDIERATAMIANLLDSLDRPPGARLVAQVDKSVESLLLYLATVRAGWVYVPLNPGLTRAESADFVGDAQPDVVVCAHRHFVWMSKLAFAAQVRQVFTLDADGRGSLLDRAAQWPDMHSTAVVAADDVAIMLYTSGTTGRSKGALLTHGNLLSNAQVLRTVWDWRQDDVLLHTLPIFHVHGLLVAAQGALIAGARMVWLDAFDPAAVLDRLTEATVFMGVPTMYTRLLGQTALTPARCARMRLFVSGSAPMQLDTFMAWRARTHHTVLERYGMSETLMLTSNPCRPGDGERRGGTVGLALPGTSVRVVGPDERVLAAGEIGAVNVHGPSVCSGYWRQPERSATDFHTDAEGRRWFKTGDVGWLSADGYLTLVGRSKDIVITGGFNVYPAEVERCLFDLPEVADAAVIGVPHADLGEAVVAVLVLRDGVTLDAGAVLARLRLALAAYKLPRQVVVADALPRNVMGKVQKQSLRDAHAQLFTDRAIG